MRVGFAQINPTVGDLTGNADKVLAAYEHAVKHGAEIVLAPELAIAGYPPRDLIFKSRFVPAQLQALDKLAARGRRRPAGGRLCRAATAPRAGTVILQRRRRAPARPRAACRAQIFAAHLRRLRRGPLFRAGGIQPRRWRSTAGASASPSARTSGRRRTCRVRSTSASGAKPRRPGAT